MRKTGLTALVVDDWKFSIFKKTLDNEGYEFEQTDGPYPGQITLKVKYDEMNKLALLVAKMNSDAAKSKMH